MVVAAAKLTSGAVAIISEQADGEGTLKPVLQVTDVRLVTKRKKAVERYRMLLSDGVHTLQSMLASAENHRVRDRAIVKGTIVHLQQFTCSTIDSGRIIIVTKLDILQSECAITGSPVPYVSKNLPRKQCSNNVAATPQARPVVHINRDTGLVIPVAQLYPSEKLQTWWAIKARVTSKTGIRPYSNADNPSGRLFTFDLLDAHGGEIRAACFNKEISLFYDKIEVDKVYLISIVYVKTAKKEYNSLNHDCDIRLCHYTSIEICPDDDSIPRQEYNFRQISELENLETDAWVDLVGVVTSVSPSSPVMRRKDGMKVQKQTLQLRDMSDRSIEVTLWGEFCDAEGRQLQLDCDSGLNPILALKHGRVKDFNGCRSLSTTPSTQLKINPEFPEAKRLRRQWCETEGRTAACVSLSQENPSIGRNDVWKTVAQIKDEDLGRKGKPEWITIKGSISNVEPDKYFYPACTKCYKKVTNNGDGMWHCEKCDRASPNCEYKYLLTCRIQDHTGVTFATAFENSGMVIIGCSAQELSTIKEEDEENFAEIIQGIRFQMYILKVKVEEETFNDKSRIKCTIVKAEKLDSSKECGYLLGAIDSILQEDVGTHNEGASCYGL